jgi:hypothetical protein
MNARDIARLLGRRGGQVRASRLSAERKREIASLGGASRARSLRAARRIADNFRYADAAATLRATSTDVKRVKRVTGRLPGIYPDRR